MPCAKLDHVVEEAPDPSDGQLAREAGPAGETAEHGHAHIGVGERLDALERRRSLGFYVATTRRFFAIDGLDHGGLLAIEFFTTVIPLVIIGFSWFRGFAANGNVGEMFIRQLDLDGQAAQTVRDTFGTAAQLRSVWTLAGLAGFLVWGIPMSITVSRMFALAWRRDQWPILARLWRGSAWFVVYLVTMFSSQRLGVMGKGAWHGGWPFRLLSLGPSFVFWAVSPVILVRNGGRAPRQLLQAGFVGMVIDAAVLRFGASLFFPALLKGWQGFGPIGVAMTLMTWSGVIGVGWVVSACAGAVLWERSAPAQLVVDTQTDDRDDIEVTFRRAPGT